MRLYMEAPKATDCAIDAAKHRRKAIDQGTANGRGLPSDAGGAETPIKRARVGAISTTSTGVSTRPAGTQLGPQNRMGTWLSYSYGDPCVATELEANMKLGLSVYCTSPDTSGCQDRREASKNGAPARLPES